MLLALEAETSNGSNFLLVLAILIGYVFIGFLFAGFFSKETKDGEALLAAVAFWPFILVFFVCITLPAIIGIWIREKMGV